MKHLFFLLLILSASTSFSQEICDNGIDDDGDGLIDLNDSVECACNYVFPNIIPNPSFEQMNCCPSTISQMYCASGWIQASIATSDYFNTCGFSSLGGIVPPTPLPAGNGYVGFVDGVIASGNYTYKEYIGSCLTSQMLAGSNYDLSFQLGFIIPNGNMSSTSPYDISVYGNANCSGLPFSGQNCPTAPTSLPATWILLGTTSVSGVGAWVPVNLNFTPTTNINAIVIGPSCVALTGLNYYYLDDIALVASIGGLQIVSDSAFCTGNEVLTAIPNAIGSHTFQWYQNGIAIVGATSSTFIVPNGLAADFQVIITDSIGGVCAVSNIYTTVNTSTYSSIHITGDSIFCQGEAVVLQANQDFVSYNWSNNATSDSIIANQIGWYWVEGTDSNGCLRRDSIFLQNYPQPILSLDSLKIGCTNGASEIFLSTNQGTPTYQYTLDNQPFQNNGGIFSSVLDGNYLVKVQDINGCQDSLPVNVVSYPPITFQIAGDSLLCFGEISNLSAPVGNYAYSWSNGSTNNQISVSNSGLFALTITANSGCNYLDSIFVQVLPQLQLSAEISGQYCVTGLGNVAISLVAGGTMPYYYALDGGSFSLNDTYTQIASGVHTVIIEDSNQCRDTLSFLMPKPLSISAEMLAPESCPQKKDGSANALISSGNPPYQYTWQPTNQHTPLLQNVGKGNYTIFVKDSAGCVDEISINISRNPEMVIDFIEKQNTYCGLDNGMIAANVSGGNPAYSYEWNSLTPQYTSTASSLFSGTYTLTATDSKGCVKTKSTSINDIPPAIPFFEISSPANPQAIYLSEANVHLLNLSQGAVRYSWNFGDSYSSNLVNPSHIYSDSGTYIITLTAYNGTDFCPQSYAQNIHILPDGEIFVPNVFSPNSDGQNDVFQIGGWGITSLEITIFDRWGKVIGTWNQPNFTWDGTKNHENVPEGVYTYSLKANFNNRPAFARSGTITLIR